MDAIKEIEQKIRKYPHVTFRREDNYIVVTPTSESGFEVGLTVLDGEYKVNFEGWHERFENEDEALDCFAFGLSSECRIKETKRGGVAYKWTLESKEGESWVEGSTVAIFFFPFWKKKEVRYLQNNLVK